MNVDDDAPVLVDTRGPDEATKAIIDALSSRNPDAESKKVPCTLITGFLGAGKSTFLKRILTERHGQRIAVIMNEFGDTADIEGRAINVATEDSNPGEMVQDFLELPNGCLCCSIKDTGVAAIEKLMQRKGSFDYILLETTGLADPGPIASMFWQNEEYAAGLGADIYLDGVVCVVDALFGEKQMVEAHTSDGISESLRQIACADVVLLNKTDLVSVEQLHATEQSIRRVNPVIPIHRTVRGVVDLKLVIGLNAYASKPLITDTNFLADLDDMHIQDEHDHGDHSHAHAVPFRHGQIASIRVSCPIMTEGMIDRLDEWIRIVLWEGRLPDDMTHEVEVLRCKGAYTTEKGELYVLQGVRNLYEMSPLHGSQKGADVPQMGKLVFIGKGLTEKAEESLRHALR